MNYPRCGDCAFAIGLKPRGHVPSRLPVQKLRRPLHKRRKVRVFVWNGIRNNIIYYSSAFTINPQPRRRSVRSHNVLFKGWSWTSCHLIYTVNHVQKKSPPDRLRGARKRLYSILEPNKILWWSQTLLSMSSSLARTASLIFLFMAYCSLRNEMERNETKWKSVVCEMKICSLRNDNLLSRCVYSDILNRKFPQKSRFTRKIQIARNAWRFRFHV